MTDEIFARDAAADARAFYLQRAFRALLDAMARPGEVCDLPEEIQGDATDAPAAGLSAAALIASDVVLDAATSVAVAGPQGAAATAVVARRTHAAPQPVERAAFCLVPEHVRDEVAADAIRALSAGTLADPQLGATAIVECATLMGADRTGQRTGSVAGARARGTWELRGPGIRDAVEIELDRIDVMEARAARGDEFPLGIDIIFVDAAGHVLALPRTTRAVRVDVPADSASKEGAAWAM